MMTSAPVNLDVALSVLAKGIPVRNMNKVWVAPPIFKTAANSLIPSQHH